MGGWVDWVGGWIGWVEWFWWVGYIRWIELQAKEYRLFLSAKHSYRASIYVKPNIRRALVRHIGIQCDLVEGDGEVEGGEVSAVVGS